MRHSFKFKWLNLSNHLPQDIRITPELRWVTLYSTTHFHYGHYSLKYFVASYKRKKMEKPLKSATSSGQFFMESAKRELNSGVTKKNKHLEETYP